VHEYLNTNNIVHKPLIILNRPTGQNDYWFISKMNIVSTIKKNLIGPLINRTTGISVNNWDVSREARDAAPPQKLDEKIINIRNI